MLQKQERVEMVHTGKKHKIETRHESKGTKMIKIYNIFDFVLIWSILTSIVCLPMVIVLCSNAHGIQVYVIMYKEANAKGIGVG